MAILALNPLVTFQLPCGKVSRDSPLNMAKIGIARATPCKSPGQSELPESQGPRNDARRPNSGATGGRNAKSANPLVNTLAEARRIAGELVKLHKTGAIKNEQDASFYANLVHLFGASFGNETSKRGATAET